MNNRPKLNQELMQDCLTTLQYLQQKQKSTIRSQSFLILAVYLLIAYSYYVDSFGLNDLIWHDAKKLATQQKFHFETLISLASTSAAQATEYSQQTSNSSKEITAIEQTNFIIKIIIYASILVASLIPLLFQLDNIYYQKRITVGEAIDYHAGKSMKDFIRARLNYYNEISAELGMTQQFINCNLSVLIAKLQYNLSENKPQSLAKNIYQTLFKPKKSLTTIIEQDINLQQAPHTIFGNL